MADEPTSSTNGFLTVKNNCKYKKRARQWPSDSACSPLLGDCSLRNSRGFITILLLKEICYFVNTDYKKVKYLMPIIKPICIIPIYVKIIIMQLLFLLPSFSPGLIYFHLKCVLLEAVTCAEPQGQVQS